MSDKGLIIDEKIPQAQQDFMNLPIDTKAMMKNGFASQAFTKTHVNHAFVKYLRQIKS